MREATRNRIVAAAERLMLASVAGDDLTAALGNVAAVQYDFPWLLHELRWELEERERTAKAALAKAAAEPKT